MNKEYNKVDISSFLTQVLKPSRYIGLELNSCNKRPESDKANFCFAFPDVYEVGFSHLGLKILYTIINSQPDATADRTYAPWPDMGKLMKENDKSLFGLESKIDVKCFDVIGFTLQSELNFSNVIYMLDIAQIPYYSKDRKDFPLIIGGGPSITNPEPLADIFDAILIGEGEEAILELKDLVNKYDSNEEILRELNKLEGWYVPAFNDKQVKIRKYWDFAKNILKHENQLIPWQQSTHDRYVAEIMRGCSRGCRFCHAGFFYRPVREKSPALILSDMLREIADNGWEEVNLASLSSSDYLCIKPLLSEIKKRLGTTETKVALPSLRVDTLDDPLIKLVESLGKGGLTIAPEAGSQRMRNVVNKAISEEEIFEGIETALRFKWQLVKLYFMIGLPFEEESDIDAIIKMVEDIIKVTGKKLRINITISPFVPKPFTPFQWAPMIDRKLALTRALRIKRALSRYKFVKVKYHEIESSLLESFFARGDKELAQLLVRAYENGCLFDGWREYFDFSKWEKSATELNIDYMKYVQARDVNEPLPWDKIDMGVTKEFFIEEWEKSEKEVITPGCLDYCTNCGVCDATHRMDFGKDDFSLLPEDLILSNNAQVPLNNQIVRYYYRIYYKKSGILKFVGHLDLMRMIYRIVRKSNLAVIYTQGFNHHPKIRLAPPLSLGIEGDNEFFEIQSNTQYTIEDIAKAFKFMNYEELKIDRVIQLKSSDKRNLDSISSELLDVIPPAEYFTQIIDGIKAFEEAEDWTYIRIRREKEKVINIKETVEYIRVTSTGLSIKKKLIGANVFKILEEVFKIPRENTGGFSIVRKEIIIPDDVIL